MTRLPLLPTLVVAAAAAAMIALGVWQIGRAEEKAVLLAEYARAGSLPTLDLDPLLARDRADLPPLAFRRVLVTCHARDAEADLRGGRSREGRSGYSWFVPCRPGADGLAGRLVVNAGWSPLPQEGRRITVGPVAGTLGAVREERPIVVTAATAPPPLQPSAPPRIEDIPNNHLMYAFQWFFFAAAALIVYALALRRRLRHTG